MSDSFSKKLYNYAPTPPENTWEGIEDALNETPLFAQKLHSYQLQPPANGWSRIEASLQNDEQENKVVPISNGSKWMRYAAAAAVVILIAGGSYFLSVGNNVAPPVAAATSRLAPSSQNNLATTGNDKNLGKPDNIAAENEHAGPIMSAANLKSYRTISKTNFSRAAINASEKQIHFTNAFVPAYAEREKRFALNANAEKYMVYSDGDGNAMRLSRRLFDMVACIKPEIECKERFEKLQQKMAGTTLTTDFTGLVAMLSTLKEN
ncbi:MAG: hypothetical protein V4676_02385 [Bacteroidota bacterium]